MFKGINLRFFNNNLILENYKLLEEITNISDDL